MPRSYAAVGTSYGQCNISSLRYEIPHNSAVGSFIAELPSNAQEVILIQIYQHSILSRRQLEY